MVENRGRHMTEGKRHHVGRTIGRVVKGVLKTALALVLVALLVVGNMVLPGYSRMINSMLGVDQSWDTSKVDTSGLDLDYDKADYDKDSIKTAEQSLDEQIAAEGYVLLKNDDGTMPFEKGTTFSFFGESSKSLGASQSMVTMMTGTTPSYDNLNSAFESRGFSVNKTLEDFYLNGNGKGYTLGAGSVSFGDSEDFSINECPLSKLEGEGGLLDSAKDTVPVFVLKRVAGEGRDMPRSMYNHATNAADQSLSYLDLDSTEREVLQYLNDNFDDAVVVINTASAVNLDWLDDYPNIKSVVSVPSAGTYGMNSLADIFAGNISPSGRTADTYAMDALGSPAAQNFGDYQYANADGSLTKYNYVSYEEGIYVGYKYYETRYEDKVLGQGNAGDYSYADEVGRSFGYGLSYTSFSWSPLETAWDGTTCTATLTVTNTGSVAGKDVVELYAQSPYTDYDQANGVEKASVSLVGYGKTDTLEPGQTQQVDITFDQDVLKSYDANAAKTYILDAGTYYITAATDAHAAVNNVLAAKGKTVADGMTADGDATLVSTYVPANADVDVTTYATDTLTGEQVTNEFDDAAGDVTYLTRADWTGTFPTHDGTASDQISTWGNELNGTDADGNAASYTYSKVASESLISKLDGTDSGNPVDGSTITDTPTYGADNGLTLADLRGKDYDDPLWDDLLDQLTADDYYLTIARGGYGTETLSSVGKPFAVDADTASGLIYGGTSMTFCTPVTVAQTWNQDIASRYGEMIGSEADLGGANGWYAPSMNIHRTPFSGRNGEYFSEDGVLSGTVASLEIKGAASKGVYATIKHLALNDQEDHRGDREGQYSIATWANEQSIREVYLKPFEMCMKVGDVDESYVEQAADGTYHNATRQVRACQAIMTSFNRIGATWTGGSYALLSGVIRGEWGFDGFIITDNANTGQFMDARQMIEAGGDSKLTYEQQDGMWSFDETSSVDYHYGRQAMHHLLYTIANSNVMDGSMPGSTFVYGLQATDKARIVINVVGIVGLALLGLTAWRTHKRRATERSASRKGAEA